MPPKPGPGAPLSNEMYDYQQYGDSKTANGPKKYSPFNEMSKFSIMREKMHRAEDTYKPGTNCS